jgi:hypothetical protein
MGYRQIQKACGFESDGDMENTQAMRVLTKQMEELPIHPRLQRMVFLVLAHADWLCAHKVGSIELHYNDASVKARLVCNPEG